MINLPQARVQVRPGTWVTGETADVTTEAVVLAAGRGKRLGPETDDRPKCLTEVGGRTLLQRQLELLKASGVRRICVVAGYQARAVQDAAGQAADIIYNDRWASTDSLYSLWLCRNWARGSLIVMNSDVLVHPEGLSRLRAVPGNAFIYDSQSGDDPEHMKVELKNGRLTAMSKRLSAERVCGENVGVLKFDAPSVSLLFREAEAALTMLGQKPRQQAAAVERLCQFAAMQGADICDLPWIEIDFPEDLERARRVTWPAIRRQAELRSLAALDQCAQARSVAMQL